MVLFSVAALLAALGACGEAADDERPASFAGGGSGGKGGAGRSGAGSGGLDKGQAGSAQVGGGAGSDAILGGQGGDASATSGAGGELSMGAQCPCTLIDDDNCNSGCTYSYCLADGFPENRCGEQSGAYRTSDDVWFQFDAYAGNSVILALAAARNHCDCVPGTGGQGGEGGTGGSGGVGQVGGAGGDGGTDPGLFCSEQALAFCHVQGAPYYGTWYCEATEVGGYCDQCPDGYFDCNSNPADGCEQAGGYCN